MNVSLNTARLVKEPFLPTIEQPPHPVTTLELRAQRPSSARANCEHDSPSSARARRGGVCTIVVRSLKETREAVRPCAGS